MFLIGSSQRRYDGNIERLLQQAQKSSPSDRLEGTTIYTVLGLFRFHVIFLLEFLRVKK